jgi:hypothetical protein
VKSADYENQPSQKAHKWHLITPTAINLIYFLKQLFGYRLFVVFFSRAQCNGLTGQKGERG